jgi:SH3-like domain-containing protein
MDGQGEAHLLVQPERRLLKRAALAVVLVGLTLPPALAAERQTPSGMPVPRYVTLKFDRVNARAGPGDDHRLLWVYRVRSLPLQVVAETSEWRRVCDPQGSMAWIHKRTTDGRRQAMNTSERPIALLNKAKSPSRVTAYLGPHAMAALDRCEDGWCRIRTDRASGWVRQGALWGTSDARQCR